MPRIEAPTVAEHHVMRHDAIVAAARELLGTAGPSAVTPAAVASRSGLARTSVYQYYPSTGALLAAAVEATFTESSQLLAEDVAAAGGPRGQVHAYVRCALTLAARDHGPFHQLVVAGLPEACLARVMQLHEELIAPLRSAVAALGVSDVDLTCALISGLITAAVQMLDHGMDLDRVVAATLRFVDAGLDATPQATAQGVTAPEPTNPS